MGSSSETTPIMMKKLIHPKIKKPEVESLKACAGMMTKIQRLTFDRKYGKILALLEVDVQVEAITALIQFYDSPVRCFTFQDFQIAPTLEEFAQILGYPLENIKPYQYLGHYPSLQTVAGVLKVQVKELQDKKRNRNGFEGFTQKYLEERMKYLAKIEDWTSFIDVLALTIYGIVIFPHIDEYIDFAAIDVFLALRDKGESPVTAVLADTYCTFNHCHEKRGKILCCLPTIYVWLVTHMFSNKCKVSCPIGDFKMCDVKVRNNREWAQNLVDLNEKTVRWYPQWQEVQEVIYQCGNFPNVPLMGTRGCINYNPSLVLRQLGYPMKDPPAEEMITPFVLYEKDMKDTEMLRRIRQAWDRVIRQSKELGKRSCDAKESYRQWLKDRVQKVGLPFQGSIPADKEIVDETLPISIEEVENLKVALLKSEEENKKLQEKLEEALREIKALHLESTQKRQCLEKANKRARVEEECKFKTQGCLRAANKELELRGKERDKALDEAKQLKELYKNSKMAERSVQRQLGDLKQQLENVVAEYEDRVNNERQHREEVEQVVAMNQEGLKKEQGNACKLKAYIRDQEKIINELKNEGMYWRNRFTELDNHVEDHARIIKGLNNESMFWKDRYTKLAWLTNQAIEDVPRLLRRAEGMMSPFSPSVEISEFIEYCKELIEKMKQRAVLEGRVKVWIQCT